MKKRLLSILLTACLLVGLTPAVALAAGSVQTNYRDYVTDTDVTVTATVVTENDTEWANGWYVVNTDAEINSRVTVSGNVHLILADGCTLTVNGGIQVQDNSDTAANIPNTNALTIYGQAGGTGQLIAQGEQYDKNAAIGGNGDYDAKMGGSGGTITISGGVVTANGGNGAAIGGGSGYNFGGSGGTITISGGTVTATSTGCGAGIGGGDGGSLGGSGGEITISGGTVKATSTGGAGIGGASGGDGGSGGKITISGGTVTATSTGGGAGIGGAGGGNFGGSGGEITISGGIVTATGSTGIGGANGQAGGRGGEITISGGVVKADGANGAGIGGGYGDSFQDSSACSGGKITIGGGTVTATSAYGGAGIGGGYGGSGGDITITGGTVTANGVSGAAGIGNGSTEFHAGDSGTFRTANNGNAVIFASSIADQSNQSSWSGIIFEGDEGKFYGASVAPSEDFTVGSGKTLTIEATQTLTIPQGVTMTNDEGTVENNGKMYVDGTLIGTVGGSVYSRLTVNGGTVTGSAGMETHDEKTYVMAGSEVTLTPDTPLVGYSFDKWVISPDFVTVDANNSFTMPSAALTVTAQWKDIEKPVIKGLENGKTYCAAVEFEVFDNDGIASVEAGDEVLTAGTNGKYTLAAGVGTVTVVAIDHTGNTANMTVTVNDGHTYDWQSENGQYWQKCRFCDDETAKKDIPEITINGADAVCVTQDYKFSFTLPQGATDPVYGYEFENKGEMGIPAIIEDNEPHGVVSLEWYEPSENSFKVYAGAKTADGFEFFVSKTVALKSEHTDAEPKDHICDICGATLSEHTGGEATCKEKAVCEYCGEEYGELDSSNHHLEKVPAKDATVTETGNKAYWHCLDCGKYFSDENAENEIELDDTVTQKLSPEIIEGKGQSVTEGEKKALTFRSNAVFGDFVRVELDGKTLDEKNYTVKEGSTVVTLKADYVATLSAGEHTIGIVSEGGTAAAAFTVNVKAANTNHSPKTDDNSHMAVCFALLAVSAAGAAGLGLYGKKRKHCAKN